MKKPSVKFFVFLLAVVSLGILSACEEGDPEYPVEITVKYLSDTTKVVPSALVRLYQGDIDSLRYSDANGKAYIVFEHEAILNVQATIDTGAGPVHFFGATTVRLQADKTVKRSVLIAP